MAHFSPVLKATRRSSVRCTTLPICGFFLDLDGGPRFIVSGVVLLLRMAPPPGDNLAVNHGHHMYTAERDVRERVVSPQICCAQSGIATFLRCDRRRWWNPKAVRVTTLQVKGKCSLWVSELAAGAQGNSFEIDVFP